MDIPKVKSRDMAKELSTVVETHTLIHEGIRERAAAYEKFLAERDKQLNADQRVTRGT